MEANIITIKKWTILKRHIRQWDIYRPDGTFSGTRLTMQAAIEYVNTAIAYLKGTKR